MHPAATTLLSLVPLFAQEDAQPVFPGRAAYDGLMAGRYLSALEAAEELGEDVPAETRLDVLGLAQSYVALDQASLETFDALRHARPQEPLASSPIDGAQALDAIPALVEAAKGRRVVVLNESHHMPRHRAFAAELARALRAEGFDTFAAETFADASVERTAELGAPTTVTGFYTTEPVFGELVREALELGYRLVAYEMEGPPSDPGDVLASIRERETAQAMNLRERVFEAHPDARLLVYVGYSHATEDWQDRGGDEEQAWMAARLAELTGLDPLTIDQTVGSPRSDPAFDDPHRRRADQRGLLPGPRVFRLEDGTFFTTGEYAGKVDVEIFHPRLPEAHGRAGWRAVGRTPLPVPKELAAQRGEGRALFQAFVAAEPEDAIPADQFLAEPGAPLPSFLLRPGTYRLVVRGPGDEVLATLEDVRVGE